MPQGENVMKTILNKEELEKKFLEAIENQYKIAISITVPGCEKTEVIVNPPENLANKLDYYKGAYNDNLTLKAYPAIKIVGVTIGNTITL